MKDAKKYIKITLTPDLEKAIDELKQTKKGDSKSEILRELIMLGINAAMKDIENTEK